VGLFPNLIDIYDISRLVETVALGSATSIFIYLTALKIYEKRSAGLIAGLVFVLAPGSIAYSRFAYPDHYVYFFSSAVLFYLICFLKDPTKNRHLAAVGLFTGMAMSVKYSAAFLVIPVFVAIVTGRCLSTPFCVRDFAKNLAITGTSALAALFLFNFSAFVNPEEFVSGFFFNVENYSSSTGTFISGITYYAIVAVVIFFGVSTFPLWIIGIWRIIKEKQIFFGTLISFPLALIAYLGSLGLVLNRNMSILIPFVVIPITGGILYIFSRDFECKSSAKRLIKVIATCAIVLSIAQACYGLVNDLKADSRVVANEWIKQNLQGLEAAGMNEFCSGQSPAVGVLPQVIYDPIIEFACLRF
jgi:4-amino-4-deoxy-L-arabinose transferase-like glycosyltransferase